MSTRRFTAALRVLSLALAAVLVIGCTRDPQPYDPKTDPLVNPPSLFEPYPKDKPESVADDETLVRVLDGNPRSLNYLFTSSRYEQWVVGLLFEGPFMFDRNLEWFVNEHMVESYKESDNHLEATLTLKKGLKWHDGEPFTAHDIQFTWEAIMDDRVPCPAVKTGRDQLKEVKALDDYTVRYVHKKALATNKWNLYMLIIPKHIYGNPEEREKDPSMSKSDYYNRYNREKVVGNGAYRLVKWDVPRQEIVFERWEDYHGEKPHFKRQICKIVSDRNQALSLFKTGQVDEVRLSEKQFATQTNDAAFAKFGVKCWASEWSWGGIGWNMDGSNPFFNDRGVRRAMAHAMNIPRISRTIYYNLVSPCYGIYHPDSWMFNRDVKRLDFDLKAAAKLLDEAGWKIDEARGGWRHKEIDSVPVKFEFTLSIPRGSSTGPQIAAIYEQDLKRIGVAVKTRVLEWSVFQERNREGEFQANFFAWGTGTDPDLGWNIWHSSQHRVGRNYGGYANEEVDELFHLGRHEFDRKKRTEYYQKIQKLIYEDQPYLFLFYRANTWAFHKRLRGIQTSPRGVFNFYPSVFSWWVPVVEKRR